MVKQAEKFASEDKKRREEVETLNQGDSVIYATERTLKEFGNKISQEERADIEAKITQVKTAIKEKNLAHVKRGMDELTAVSHKLAEKLYQQTATTNTEDPEAKKSPEDTKI